MLKKKYQKRLFTPSLCFPLALGPPWHLLSAMGFMSGKYRDSSMALVLCINCCLLFTDANYVEEFFSEGRAYVLSLLYIGFNTSWILPLYTITGSEVAALLITVPVTSILIGYEYLEWNGYVPVIFYTDSNNNREGTHVDFNRLIVCLDQKINCSTKKNLIVYRCV